MSDNELVSDDEPVSNDELIDLENVTPTLRDQVFTGIQCGYGLFGILIIVCLLIVMYSKKNAKTFRITYYTLVAVDLISSLLIYLNTWTGNRMKNHPILVQALKQIELFVPGSLTASRSLFNLFLPIQFVTSFAQTFYHYTVFPCTFIYKNYPWFFKVWHAVGFIICAVYYAFLLKDYGVTSHISIMDQKLVANNHNQTIHSMVLISAIASIIFGFLFIFVWILIVISWRRQSARSQPISAFNHKRMIKRGRNTAFVNGLSFLAILVWSIACYFSENSPSFDGKLRLDTLMFCSDFKTFATPICVLFFDKNIQRDLLAKCSKKEQSPATRAFVRRSAATSF